MTENKTKIGVLSNFEMYLQTEEKSANTIEKYLRDVRSFLDFAEKKGIRVSDPDLRGITKETVIAYKNRLTENGYKARSINSMLASLHCFFEFIGRRELKVKTVRIVRQIFCSEAKELNRAEFERLCRAAKSAGNERLLLILQTLCGTGIRVSELPFVTVDAVQAGQVSVTLKGKTRTVFFVKELRKKLLCYLQKQNIRTGPVFVTRTGNPLSRTNIWREMKLLCETAGVDPKKVFPHNLRHLFARIFYRLEKDIAKLADVLGHSSIETTRIYIISSGHEHRRIMENMRLIV